MPLIIDRSGSDIFALNELRQKLINRTATPEEWDLWFSGMHGAINISDFVRIEQELSALVSGLGSEGYTVVLTPQNLALGDYLTEAAIGVFLENISKIRTALKVLPATPAVPSSLLTYTQANDIEQILLDVSVRLAALKKSRHYCGEFYSGELL